MEVGGGLASFKKEMLAFGGGNYKGARGTSSCLTSSQQRMDLETETFVTHVIGKDCLPGSEENTPSRSLETDGRTVVAHTLTKRHDSSEDGSGRGTPLVVNSRQDPIVMEDSSMPLDTKTPAHSVLLRSECPTSQEEVAHTVKGGGGGSSKPHIQQEYIIRRLTPLECERLMGLPDNYTLVPNAVGRMMSNSERYALIGNGIAINQLEWLGDRIRTWEKVVGE